MDKNALINELKERIKGKKDTDREYETALSKLISKDFDDTDENNMISIIEEKCNSREKDIAYAAFFALITYYRHQLDNPKLNDFWICNKKHFEQYDSIDHLKILYFLFNINSSNLFDEKRHLEIARNNINRYLNSKTGKANPGFNHALADLFACICEKYENNPDILKQFKENWYETSMKAAEDAITGEEGTAVFHCTKGRILSVFGEYDEADMEFSTAISLELSNRSDYSLKIGKYQYYKLLNQTRKQVGDVQAKVKKAKNEIKDARTSNVETIGIFSGVVSFVIGSLKIADGASAVEAGFLILTLMGCLTGALAVFSLLLHLGDDRKKTVHILVIVFSILLAFGSVLGAKFL